MRSFGRMLAAAAVLVTAAIAVPTASAAPLTGAAPPPPPGPLPASTPNPGLYVLDQSPWVTGPHGDFTIGLRLNGGGASPSDHLRMYLYPRLTTRTDFQSFLEGKVPTEYLWRSQPLPVSSLPQDGNGVKIDLPVDPTSTSGPSSTSGPATLTGVTLGDQNGVYPVQIGLTDSFGQFIGKPLTTYLVWVPAPTGFPKLDVSWVVPVHAAPAITASGQPASLPASEATALEGEVDALSGHPGAPVSLQVDPQTVAALQSAGPAGKATVANLASLPPADQVLSAPYVSLDYAGMEAAGLDGEVVSEFRAGASTLDTLLNAVAPPGAWVQNGQLDPATGAGLVGARGVTHLVVPREDLSALPSADLTNTFAQPALLDATSGKVAVAGADTPLGQHFTDTGDQVLQANQFLAELAMIDTEQPSYHRGVAVLTPTSWTPQTSFIATALAGLVGNPLLKPVTVDQFFSDVPLAGPTGQPLTRNLVGPRPAPVPDADAVRTARNQLNALAVTFPSATSAAKTFATRVLVAESADLSGRQRSAAFAAFSAAVLHDMDRIQVAPGESITLTARDGNVPVTVLSGASGPAHVQLQLSSQKLTFRSFTPAGGNCRSPNATTVVCDLTLTLPATTLKVPVVTRTSGVFSLELSVKSADGTLVLGQARYAVRSTAVSAVAVVLMIGAAVLLGVWWVRDRRHGRRARQLVDPPGIDDPGLDNAAVHAAPRPGVPEPPAAGDPDRVPEAELWVDHDPVVAEFFASPPPDYPHPAARPPDAPRPLPDPPASRAGRSR